MSGEDKMFKLIAKKDPQSKNLEWVFARTPSKEAFCYLVKKLQEDFNSPRNLIMDQIKRLVGLLGSVMSKASAVASEEMFKETDLATRESAAFKAANAAEVGKTLVDYMLSGMLYLRCDSATITQ